MSVFEAVLLGLVQGLTEFLPVSSSGHLVLLPRLLGWDPHPLSFDVTLHLGTMLAVLLYFRTDFVQLTCCTIRDAISHRHGLHRWSAMGRLGLLIILGSIPAALVGGLLGDVIEEHARSAWLVAVLLVAGGLLMLAAEKWGQAEAGLERLDGARTLVVGIAQACALLPGVSRSGATISAGMLSGLARPAAARFSFLLAAPVILGAGLKELPNIRNAAAEGVGWDALFLGCLISFLAGVAAIHGLLRYVATRSLAAFAWYRFGLALVIVVLLVWR